MFLTTWVGLVCWQVIWILTENWNNAELVLQSTAFSIYKGELSLKMLQYHSAISTRGILHTSHKKRTQFRKQRSLLLDGKDQHTSEWIMDRAVAMKYLLTVHETMGKAELFLLCSDFWLSSREILSPGPMEAPQGAPDRGSSTARSEGHQQKQGWHIGVTLQLTPVYLQATPQTSGCFSPKWCDDKALKYMVTPRLGDTAPCHCCPDDLWFSLQRYDNKIRVWRRKMTDKSRRLPVLQYNKVSCSVWKYKTFTSVESYLVHSHPIYW